MTTIAHFSSQNTLDTFTMRGFQHAISEGHYEIRATEIEDVIVEFILIDEEGASVELTRENPMFQTVRNAIVDDSGLTRLNLDITFYYRDLSRGSLETYCRAVLLNPFIENRMELVERAVRTVQHIEAKEAKGA